MKFLFDQSFPLPAQNLACDEALLGVCEDSATDGFLRFWESNTYFVVLGYGKRLAEEVYEETCRKLKIPILRRSSGGGTVLQGPGCLNYSLVMPIERETESIAATNCHVMQLVRASVSSLIKEGIEIQGHTDLTCAGFKFCGNAQRRKRRCFLFHGAFLLNFDLALLEGTLRLPLQQPEYRKNRRHLDFVRNLGLSSDAIKKSLSGAWDAGREPGSEMIAEIYERTDALAESKYNRDEWNRRY